MRGVSVKSEYGPTLTELLVPRFRSLAPAYRRLLLGAMGGLAVGVVALGGLWPRAHHFSHSGSVSFNLKYSPSFQRMPAQPGGLLKVVQAHEGKLVQSFAVALVRLGPHRGDPSAELPVFAGGYIRRLAAQHDGFLLLSEGKTSVFTYPGYAILYRAREAGQTVYGRDDLLVPDVPRRRDGVALSMLATPASGPADPSKVGATGPLSDILRSFSFGS